MTSAEKSKSCNNNRNNGSKGACCKHGKTTNWNTKIPSNVEIHKCSKHKHKSNNGRRADSVLSTDSDIRFTRRKLGDSQRCGCAVVAGILVALLIASVFVYVGYIYLRPDALPDKVFRLKFRVVEGDMWTTDLADQNSLRFQQKARDYKERINLLLRRSDLRDIFEKSEILALDGEDDESDLIVHVNLIFDPYRGIVSAADLIAIFSEEFRLRNSRYFTNLTIDSDSLVIKEITGFMDDTLIVVSSSQEKNPEIEISTESIIKSPPRRCEALGLSYCKTIGYNITTYPNLLGQNSLKEVENDLIAFRELVDAECFRQAFDFVCRLLQPPCVLNEYSQQSPGQICREYCQSFFKGCGERLPLKFQKYFDCELFPEVTGAQSCRSKPGCTEDLINKALSPRLCDGIADCPDLSDEMTCSFCPKNSMNCGRGRACISKHRRCDGKIDCPDGSDEKNCLLLAPTLSQLMTPTPIVSYAPKFYPEGFIAFLEKGLTGKLCAEGLDKETDNIYRHTVAESLCKSLGYESVKMIEIRNDTELIKDFVRVVDPQAPEIKFARTSCPRKQTLYAACDNLQCGVQSVLSSKHTIALPKVASLGDWPWLVSLFREDTHVCDGTLISKDWVLTTESCFQGQPKATWLAVFGIVRLNSKSPWTQRRRIIGLVKSPVEGSTAALIRLESSIEFSDFVRPICLPDEMSKRKIILENQPNTESLIQISTAHSNENMYYNFQQNFTAKEIKPKETREYFVSPNLAIYDNNETINGIDQMKYLIEDSSKNIQLMAQAEALKSLSESLSQVDDYEELPKNNTPQSLIVNLIKPKISEHTWTNCNTLGWSRQRGHLQRVQLKIGEMSLCENVSIATVNSMCAEATYQKNDCSEEEFAGSPVVCLIPETNQWALVGIASWRIACAPPFVGRPRMYDKISSNTAWIRDTINAI